jgi:hypothetical protein
VAPTGLLPGVCVKSVLDCSNFLRFAESLCSSRRGCFDVFDGVVLEDLTVFEWSVAPGIDVIPAEESTLTSQYIRIISRQN